MYMDAIKRFANNDKKLETLIDSVRIYSQDIGMEFGIEKCTMLVMKSHKRHLTVADTIKRVEMKDKIKNISEEQESYSRQNYQTETVSKE